MDDNNQTLMVSAAGGIGLQDCCGPPRHMSCKLCTYSIPLCGSCSRFSSYQAVTSPVFCSQGCWSCRTGMACKPLCRSAQCGCVLAAKVSVDRMMQISYAIWHQALSEESRGVCSPSKAVDSVTWGSFVAAKMLRHPHPG